nr:5-deoxy-glucuronate isomerase [Pyrinomonadaceae bacterium]
MKDLLIKPDSPLDSSGETLVVTPESAGFEYLTFRVRKILRGDKFSSATGACELGMVVLGGRCSVESTAGSWSAFG